MNDEATRPTEEDGMPSRSADKNPGGARHGGSRGRAGTTSRAGSVTDGPHLVIPVDDPLSTLPETAVRVLEAAQRVVEERGLQALTLNTVARETGHPTREILHARPAAVALWQKMAAANGDDGTNDVLVSDVIRRNELQVWFVSEHIAGAGIADRDEETARSAAAVQV